MNSVCDSDGRCSAPPFLFPLRNSQGAPRVYRTWSMRPALWQWKARMVAIGYAAVMLLTVLSGSLLSAEGFPAVQVYERSAGAVVLITAHGSGVPSLAGAGTIVTEEGGVITNAHVVIDPNTGDPFDVLRVFLKPEQVTGDLGKDLSRGRRAAVVAFDTELDLALLQIEDQSHARLPSLTLANPADMRIGEEVVAIGHPEQGGLWSLTYGRISGQIPNYAGVRGKDVFQTDTSLNRGNSGGPLLDRRGYVVGINTSIARLAPDKLPITGVNFTLKSSVVREWLGAQGVDLSYGTLPLGEGRDLPSAGGLPARGAEGARRASPGGEGGILAGPQEPADATLEKAGPGEAAPGRAWQPPKSSEERVTGGDGAAEEDRILTPRKPYTMDALFGEVEEEMQEMMDEMREKIDRGKRP